MNIEEVIRQGESQTVEFKRSLSLAREALESLSGMVNADVGRGIVVFGVSPNGEAHGIEPGDIDKAQRSLSQLIANKVEPRINVQMVVADVSGKRLLVVTAERVKSTPYHEYDGRAFIREGTVTRQLTLSEKGALTRPCDRDHHSGPWRCDRCGAIAGMIGGLEVTDRGVKKSYSCSCGGEYWPAT